MKKSGKVDKDRLKIYFRYHYKTGENNPIMSMTFVNYLKDSTKLSSEYLETISHIYTSAKDIWKIHHVNPYTDHSLSHSERIIKFALQIANKLKDPLSDEESLLLLSGCLLHDVGMQYKRFAEKNMEGEANLTWDEVRNRHADYSVLIMRGLLGDEDILKRLKGLLPRLTPVESFLRSNIINPKSFISVLSTIILSHTRDSQGREAGWHAACQNTYPGSTRIDLLAALLRFSDELDVTKQRIGESGYDMFASDSIPLDSLQYWLASTVIDKIIIEEQKCGISVSISPHFHSIPSDKNLSDLAFFLIYNVYKKLIRALNKPIIPSINTVGDVFSKYGINLRICKLEYRSQRGLLEKNNDAHYIAFQKVLERLTSAGFLSEHFSIEVYRFKKLKNTRACLINEMAGLMVPDTFKEKLVDWLVSKFHGSFSHTHTCFSRCVNLEHNILEYLPDKSVSSHSIIGAAAATKSFGHSIEKMTLLPDNIPCRTEYYKNSIDIIFPSFANTSFTGKKIDIINKWSLLEVVYPVPAFEDKEAVALALLTDLGNTTLVVIPASQDFEFLYSEDLTYLPATGIRGFFNEQPRKISDREKWAKERETLLINITKSFKAQYNIRKNIVCAIVDYIETKKHYQVIAWRDSTLRFADFLHAGIIASSFFYLDEKSRSKFADFPLRIPTNHFPSSSNIDIELWGGTKDNFFAVNLLNDDNISLSLEIEKAGEIRTRDFIGSL